MYSTNLFLLLYLTQPERNYLSKDIKNHLQLGYKS